MQDIWRPRKRQREFQGSKSIVSLCLCGQGAEGEDHVGKLCHETAKDHEPDERDGDREQETDLRVERVDHVESPQRPRQDQERQECDENEDGRGGLSQASRSSIEDRALLGGVLRRRFPAWHVVGSRHLVIARAPLRESQQFGVLMVSSHR